MHRDNLLQAGLWSSFDLLEGIGVLLVGVMGRGEMKTCEMCGKRTRAIDADGFCEQCRGLAEQFRAKGHSIIPDTSGRIGERIPIQPDKKADVSCSACERPITSLDDQETDLNREGKPLHFHRLCRKIVICL